MGSYPEGRSRYPLVAAHPRRVRAATQRVGAATRSWRRGRAEGGLPTGARYLFRYLFRLGLFDGGNPREPGAHASGFTMPPLRGWRCVVAPIASSSSAVTRELGSFRRDGPRLPPGLSCKEFERFRHEVRVELEHRAVSGIGIDDEIAIRKTPRQIVRVLAWNHAITVAVYDKHRLEDL